MKLKAILRIARRDAGEIMKSRTYVILLFAPALLTLLLTFLVAAVTLLLSLIKVAAPEGAPLGHDVLAAVIPAEADAETRDLFSKLVTHLSQKAPVAPREARLVKRFATFLLQATGRANKEADHEISAADASYASGINVVMFTDGRFEKVRGEVPEKYDAAIFLEPLEDGQAEYELVYDSALLFSRTMQRRVEERVEDFNHLRRMQAMDSDIVGYSIHDQPSQDVDLWLINALVSLCALGLAFLYHSVGVQSVAGVLAGERESRTLEILLSLPITRRQVLYGKTAGLVLTTATPTLLWTLGLWLPMKLRFGLSLPFWSLLAVLLALLFFLMSVGCAVSASSPNTTVAKNRLGVVNMAVFAVGGALLALPSSMWPGSTHPLTGLVKACSGAPDSLSFLLLAVLGLLGAGVVVLELGLVGFRRA